MNEKQSGAAGPAVLARIEDFIALAEHGKKIRAECALHRQPITYRVHRAETEDQSDERDGYLLSGEFTFAVEDRTWRISKVYDTGFAEESSRTAQVNRNVATQRLKADCARLTAAGIKVQPKSF